MQKLTANRVKSPNMQREKAVISSCVHGASDALHCLERGCLAVALGKEIVGKWLNSCHQIVLGGFRAFGASGLLEYHKMVFPAADASQDAQPMV